MPSVAEYYVFLTQLTAPIRDPLIELSYNDQIPFLTAFVLGLIGALSPCQLSTNLAAFAFITRDATDSERVTRSTFAFVLGKVLIYSMVGGTAILLGLQLAQVSIPVVVFTRKALGPLLIFLGLLMLGVIKISTPLFARASEYLKSKLGERHDTRGSFLLGVTFSFAACPTLFVLFFSTLLPLAVAVSLDGLVFPAIFALGTSMPLILFIALAATGAQSMTPFVKNLRALNLWISRLAALVFILVGVNEIVLYWLM